jgi:hypothetical protein
LLAGKRGVAAARWIERQCGIGRIPIEKIDRRRSHETATGRLAARLLLYANHRRDDEAAFLLLIVVGALVYAGAILLLFGRRWVMSLVRG